MNNFTESCMCALSRKLKARADSLHCNARFLRSLKALVSDPLFVCPSRATVYCWSFSTATFESTVWSQYNCCCMYPTAGCNTSNFKLVIIRLSVSDFLVSGLSVCLIEPIHVTEPYIELISFSFFKAFLYLIQVNQSMELDMAGFSSFYFPLINPNSRFCLIVPDKHKCGKALLKRAPLLYPEQY